MRIAWLCHVYALMVLLENHDVILDVHVRFNGHRPFALEALNKVGQSTNYLLSSELFFKVQQRTFDETTPTMVLRGIDVIVVTVLFVVLIIADEAFDFAR